MQFHLIRGSNFINFPSSRYSISHIPWGNFVPPAHRDSTLFGKILHMFQQKLDNLDQEDLTRMLFTNNTFMPTELNIEIHVTGNENATAQTLDEIWNGMENTHVMPMQLIAWSEIRPIIDRVRRRQARQDDTENSDPETT